MKRLLLIGFALLIALALGILTWLFESESGLLWAYRQAESRLPGTLAVKDISGRLSGSVRLEGLRYEDRGQTFKVGQVTVNWDPWALIKAEIDVSSLQIGALEVSLPESSDASDSPEADTTAPLIQLPLALKLRNAQIDGLVVNRGGRHLPRGADQDKCAHGC